MIKSQTDKIYTYNVLYNTQKKPQYPGGQYWIMLLITVLTILFFAKSCSAQDYTTEQIADAIYLTEGGAKTKFPYGIKSLKYENRSDKKLTKIEWARKICINTINNHKKRHAKHACGKDFVACLGDRYCPLTITSEYNLNKNWVSLVNHFLTKEV